MPAVPETLFDPRLSTPIGDAGLLPKPRCVFVTTRQLSASGLAP